MFEYPGKAMDTFWGLRSHSSGVIIPGFTNSRIPSFWDCTHNLDWRGQVFKLIITRRRLQIPQRILRGVSFSWCMCAALGIACFVEKCLFATRCIPCPRITSVEAEAWRLSVVQNNHTDCSTCVTGAEQCRCCVHMSGYSDYWRVGGSKELWASGNCI